MAWMRRVSIIYENTQAEKKQRLATENSTNETKWMPRRMCTRRVERE